MERILEIERKSFDKPWSEFHFREEFTKPEISINWVYMQDAVVLAYLFGWMVEDEYHLNNIAVDADYRKQGIGKKLMKKMIEFVTKSDGQNILLEVMHENSSAIRLYEKMGFKVVGDRKDYYTKGQHAICFNLELKNG